MILFKLIVVLTLIFNVQTHESDMENSMPPHCTQVTKDTDYVSRFIFDYPAAYILPGQREAYQPMYCVNPATVNKAVSRVCDWVAPPQVIFTLGDEYLHVVRQDPTGRYLGNAVITTVQYCNHNFTRNSDEATTITNNNIIVT